MSEKLYYRNVIKNIENFIVYYGRENENELSKYDLVIVEPLGQNEKSIKFMKDNNTIVFAYVSFLEVHEMSPGYSILKEEDFLIDNKRYVVNDEYHTKLVDLSSKRWSSILVHHIGNLHKNFQYDGIFVDTLSDIEYFSLSSITKTSLLNSAVNLLCEIRRLFPDLMIIQNNGFEYLYLMTGNYINGMCIENPIFFKEKNILGYVKDKLDDLQKSGITIFFLTNEKCLPKEDRRLVLDIVKGISIEKNFLHYNAVHGYERI